MLFVLSAGRHSTLRSKVSFSRAHFCFVGNATQLHANRAEGAIAVFVGGIIADAVLSADLISDPRKRRPRILKTVGNEVSAATVLGQVVHLFACEVVKIAANLHALERAHGAKGPVVLGARARIKDAAIALQLF